MTNLERWERFALIYVLGMVILAPAWIPSAHDPSGGSRWLFLCLSVAAPLVQTLLALRLDGPRRALPLIAAFGGAFAVYGLTYSAVPLLSGVWDGMAMMAAWSMAVVAPVLAGAALAQLLASAMLHAGHRLLAHGGTQAKAHAGRLAAGPGYDARITVSIAAAVTGGIAGIALFIWLCFWGMAGVWSDAIYVLAFGAPLSAPAASAAFLVWFLGRES